MNNLAEKLAAIREELMYTIQTFAMKLNLNGYRVSKHAVEMYESGKCEPPVSYLTALVHILNVNPYFLLSDKSDVFIPYFDKQAA